jgi:hypothetical protein
MRLIGDDEPPREISTGAMDYFEMYIGKARLSIERGIGTNSLRTQTRLMGTSILI